jgi:alpha-ketoglutarate-dependent taurine dioxygenase
MTFAPLSKDLGIIIHQSDIPDLSKINVDVFIELLRTHGVLLFSGYDYNQDEVSAFIHGFGHTLGSLDVYTDRAVLEPHAEMALNPASSGGQTTVCDGIKILNAMDEPTKRFLYTVPAQFNTKRSPPIWKKMFSVETKEEAIFKFNNLADIENFKYRFDINDNLYCKYTVSQIVKSRLLNVDAFANTILIAKEDRYGLIYADGSLNAGPSLEYLTHLTEEHTIQIEWKPREFVLIDNTRVMHGRRAYTDPKRLLKAYHTLNLKQFHS